MNSIFDLLFQHAANMPDQTAILLQGHPPMPYRMLAEHISSTILKLRSAGIEKADRVGVVLPEGAVNAVACLSVMGGATCAPLYPGYSASEFEVFLATLGARAVLLEKDDSSAIRGVAESMGLQILELQTSAGAPAGTFSIVAKTRGAGDFEPSVTATDTALLLFTSGTSARPKLVPLSHGNITASALSIASALQLTSDDRCQLAMPLYHIHGLSTLLATIVSGGSFISMPGFTAEMFLACLGEFRPTWYSASPTVHRAILDQAHSLRGDLRDCGLRLIRSASAAMPKQLILEIEKIFGVPLIEAYGMTEASPQIATNRPPPFQRKSGSVGTAAGPEVGVMDAGGTLLSPGKTGEVVTRGRNVTQAYENDPGANATSFTQGWLRTGDLGHVDEDGYLFITGRLKEIINRGGEKISPHFIEDILLEHPAIEQAAVFAVPHASLGENVAAAIVLRPYFRESLARPCAGTERQQHFLEEIREYTATRLAHFEVPQQLIIVDQIPSSPNGKVSRSDLAKRLGVSETGSIRAMRGDDSVQPRTATERCIAAVFAEVLKKPPHGIHDSFFDLGGDSLTAMQVIARLESIFQITLPRTIVFERPTPTQLAECIGQRIADLIADGKVQVGRKMSPLLEVGSRSIPRRPDSSVAPLSFTQEQVYFSDQLQSGSAYNISAPLWLLGTVCERTLARTLGEICRRHESLRTTFRMTPAGPVQVIHEPQTQSLDVIDLSGMAEANRETEAKRLATLEAAKPFDLAEGPLLRAKLIRVTQNKHLLLLVMHHIISDGWSIGILYREIKALYDAFLAGRGLALGELPCQFGDFTAWQRRRVRQGSLKEQITYWKGKLANLPYECTFPTDRLRPAIPTYRGAILQTPVTPLTVDRLKQVAQSCQATLFMPLLAAFKTLLFRHNTQLDCVVGIPAAHRLKAELESVIGLFANTLVLRTDMGGDPTFLDLLLRVRATSLEATANQEIPLEHIVEELNIDRDVRRNAVFQVMFAYQNLHAAEDSVADGGGLAPGRSFEIAGGAVAKPFRIDNGTSKFDLTLYLLETDAGMMATWQYNTDLYRTDTIRSIASQFQTLLDGIATNPDRRLSELPLMSGADLHTMTLDWNRTDKDRKVNHSFVELFEEIASNSPDRIALIDSHGQWTYCQLNERANQIARHFRTRGMGAATLVAVCLERSAEWVPVILGIWKAGGAYLPLDPEYPAERLASMMKHAEPILLVGNRSTLHTIKRDRDQRVLFLEDDDELIAQQSKANLQLITNVHDLAYVMCTSGFNGQPRGVMITHGNVCHYTQSMVEALGIEPTDRYLHTASFAFSSSVRQFAVPLARGAACVIASNERRRDPIMLFELLRHRGVTIIDLVPSHWMSCLAVLKSLDAPTRTNMLDNSLRLILSASEPLPANVARDWDNLFKPGVKRINMYGQTETCGIVMTHTLSGNDETTGAVPIGRPIANTQVFVLDESLRLSPVGVTGELYVGGLGLGKGYLNGAERTAQTFVANPFSPCSGDLLYQTGDLARYRDNGVIEFVGRKDSQVKIRGFRIEPTEIESILCTHADVRESAVLVIKDQDPTIKSDQIKLRAFVTLAPQAKMDRKSCGTTLRNFLRGQLPDYLVPSTITLLDHMLRTDTGKIDRIALSKMSAVNDDLPVSVADPRKRNDAPQTESESILADVFKSVLNLETVGVNENFFDLGGNSLLSINVMMRARELGVHFNLSQLFQHQTVAELAKVASDTSLETSTRAGDDSVTKEWTIRMRPRQSSVLVTAESLRAYGIEALRRVGLAEEGARIVAEVQLEANLRGQLTHNMISIPRYAKRLAMGKLNPQPVIRVERETGIIAQIDGDNAPGQWVSTIAMDVAIRKAQVSGVGIAAVRRSNHFGAAGHYVWEAAKRGLIGLCTTNGPLILAPTGGTTPTFGNNPIGVGIPAQSYPPILLDIAMSVAPRGKIGLNVAEGKSLPHGWILDKLGRPSTDLADLAAGLGVPIGGHKGYGLALVMEVLSGVLSGSGFCADHGREALHHTTEPPDFGHFFLAIDPASFMSTREFLTRVDRLIEQTKTSELAESASEILVPGEMEMRARERSLKEGVRLRASAYRVLLGYANDAVLATELQVIQQALINA